MTRDETVALFERCETARAEARAAALAEGKGEWEAREIAHQAAKAIWNGWAKGLLAERKALEETGRWAAEKHWAGYLEAKNEDTRQWMEAAETSFLRCHFLVSGEVASEEAKEESSSSGESVKSVYLSNAAVDFSGFVFPGAARFHRATFSGDAWFGGATFRGVAGFDGSTFSGAALFNNAQFAEAWFKEVKFNRAEFARAKFVGKAVFESVHFSGNAFFTQTVFFKTADFSLAKFDQYAGFDAAEFHGAANFNAMRGDKAFAMADAVFKVVPDFIQAHFEEAPRLDNVHVTVRMIRACPDYKPRRDSDGRQIAPNWGERTGHAIERWGSWPGRFAKGAWRRATEADRDIPARWRALKRLAIQAHDQDREHAFFAGEVRSARFAGDWPAPWPVWKTSAWLGFFRFWFGILYGLFSNYGRSVAQPTLWWAAGVAIAAMFYLGEQQGMADERKAASDRGVSWPYVATTREAWRSGRPCYASPKQIEEELRPPQMDVPRSQTEIIGVSRMFREQTSAPYEALQLALRDGFLILYGDADTAHRIYGCLYGVELYGGGTPVAIVPPQIGFWSAMHKLWSAVMIFLFGLALRNMLKMK